MTTFDSTITLNVVAINGVPCSSTATKFYVLGEFGIKFEFQYILNAVSGGNAEIIYGKSTQYETDNQADSIDTDGYNFYAVTSTPAQIATAVKNQKNALEVFIPLTVTSEGSNVLSTSYTKYFHCLNQNRTSFDYSTQIAGEPIGGTTVVNYCDGENSSLFTVSQSVSAINSLITT